MAEYCDTPQSKERRNRKNKVCLNERALLLLNHEFLRIYDVLQLWKNLSFFITESTLWVDQQKALL